MTTPTTYDVADIRESVAARVPERIAAVCGDRLRTFAELDRRTGRLADENVTVMNVVGDVTARPLPATFGSSETGAQGWSVHTAHVPTEARFRTVDTLRTAVPDVDEPREHGRGLLAGFEVPERFVGVDEVPRGPAGKPDPTWASARALENPRTGAGP